MTMRVHRFPRVSKLPPGNCCKYSKFITVPREPQSALALSAIAGFRARRSGRRPELRGRTFCWPSSLFRSRPGLAERGRGSHLLSPKRGHKVNRQCVQPQLLVYVARLQAIGLVKAGLHRFDPHEAQFGGPRIEPVHKRSEEHTSELQSPCNLVCRLLLEKKKIKQ